MSLIILCASHLKTEQNAEQMREMLDSQMSQTKVCDVYVSYTGLSLEFDDSRVHLIKQPEEQLAQFQHYKRLVRTLCDTCILHSENYAIFTDDDDIMAPERNAEYLRLIRDRIDVVRIDKSVVRFSLDQRVSSLQEALKRSVCDKLHEYVDLCLRGDVLLRFVDEVDGENYISDCVFNMIVQRYIIDNPAKCIEIETNKPLYYYRYSMFRGVRHKYLKEANKLPRNGVKDVEINI